MFIPHTDTHKSILSSSDNYVDILEHKCVAMWTHRMKSEWLNIQHEDFPVQCHKMCYSTPRTLKNQNYSNNSGTEICNLDTQPINPLMGSLDFSIYLEWLEAIFKIWDSGEYLLFKLFKHILVDSGAKIPNSSPLWWQDYWVFIVWIHTLRLCVDSS